MRDVVWKRYNGPQAPRRLSQSALAQLLRPFGIQPRAVWPPGPRQQRGSSRRGYRRDQFTSAWAAYCQSADTPTHGSKIKHLRRI
jgi:hypothetical protein